ncbi:MAG: glycosyltransferase family 9 protein [Planctomycetota bacterium]|jgi:lipopolysaccharide heptosyltransferase I
MKTGNYKNILIIKPSALGDIVHALPVLPSLRAAFPQARLTWLARKEFSPLLECVEGLDEILLFDRKAMAKWFCCPRAMRCLLDFRKQLRQGQFDLVLDLQGLFRSGIFARMTGCGERIGMKEAREFAHLFHTQQVPRPADSVHILDSYFAVLKAIGIENCIADCRLTVPETAQEAIRSKLESVQLETGKFAVLVPSSAHTYKCWPAEKFAMLAEAFHQQYGWPSVVVGTKSEAVYARTIQANATTPVVDLTGQTSIPELIALFERGGAVVSNDTGPGHIALATDTPGVIVFGNTNPRRLGPYGRPECVAAVDAEIRGAEIKDADPAHAIGNVTIEMVLEKMNGQMKQ